MKDIIVAITLAILLTVMGTSPAAASVPLGIASDTDVVTSATPSGGTYSGPLMVSLSSSIPATIFYTTNGNDPLVTGVEYTTPLPIPSSTTLKFVMQGGTVQTQTYVIKDGTVTYTDGTFTPADWNFIVKTAGKGGAFTPQQSPAGGNTGSFLSMNSSAVSTSDSFLYGTGFKAAAVYAPSTQGAISSIAYSEDRRDFSGSQASGPALIQAGKMYIASAISVPNQTYTAWTTLSVTSLTANDFGELDPWLATGQPGGHPDFSTAGAPITFGFYRANSYGGAGDSGMDNWSVSVVPVPALINDVSVTITGTPSGTVTTDTGVLTWSGDMGTATYLSGAVVNLTAVPANGSAFNGWTGCDTVAGMTCTVTLTTAKSLSVAFGPMPVTTASPSGKTFVGSLDVTLTASPAATIYYTTSGLDPTDSSAHAASPVVTLTATTLLKFFAKDSFGNREAIKFEQYVRATAPGAPTGVTAVLGNGEATITFSAPTGNGGSPITGYTVTSSPGEKTVSGTSTTLTVTGLTNGTPYTFIVTATNAAGTSLPSAPSASVTPATVPGVPTAVTASRGNGLASVSFTPPADNGGSVVTGYTVTSSPGGLTVQGPASPIIFTGLTNGTSYTFTVTATNAQGTGGASTPSTAVTPATVPGAPTIGTVTAGNAEATVSFTPSTDNGGSDVIGYTVASIPGGFTANGTGSPITVTGLANGTSYTFKVRATNSVGDSAFSAASGAVTPLTVPGAPTNVTAVPGNQQAVISFTAPSSNGGSVITAYTVVSEPAGGVDTNAGSTALSHTITGLTNGTSYTFTVTAVNSAGSGASATSTPVTPNQVSVTVGAPTRQIAKTGDTVTYTVTYTSADTVTLNAAGVTLNRTGTANGTVSVSGSDTATRTVSISNLTGDGTIGITIAAGTATTGTGTGTISSPVSAPSETFTVDNIAPTLTLSSPVNSIVTSNNTATVTGTVTEVNSVMVNGNPVSVVNGSFTTAVTLADGANTITVLAADAADNRSTVTRTVVYDHTAPVITFSTQTPADNSFTRQGNVVITGTLSEAGTVIVKVNDNAPVTATMAGLTFSAPITLPLGSNIVTVIATDGAGNSTSSTYSRTITFDNLLPAVAITDPAQDITTTLGTYMVQGTASDATTSTTIAFAVDGVAVSPAPLLSGGAFSQSITLSAAKTYTISVTATDQAGNSSTAQRNIVYHPVLLADALRALRIAVGLVSVTVPLSGQDTVLDVAPLLNGKPHPDGVIDISDAAALLRRSVNLDW